MNNIKEVLTVGMEIKNYKQLVHMLGEKEKGGTSRIAQHKEWERYFKYRKEGQKYIIEEVYEAIMPKVDNRSNGNNSVYVKYIETILLHLLSEQHNQTMVRTKKDLYAELGMTSLKYIDNYTRGILVDTYQFKQNDIDEFDNRACKILDRVLFSALKSLKNRCLLEWNQELHISAKDDCNRVKEWVANEDEVRLYTQFKFETLEQLGELEGNKDKYDKLFDIYLYRKANIFYKLLNKKMKKECGWDNTYVAYRIIYTTKNVISAIPKTERQLQELQDANLEENKLLLNDSIIQALNNNAKSCYANLYNKFYDEYDNLCIDSGYDLNDNPLPLPLEIGLMKHRLPSKSYIETQENIADRLVKRKIKDV